MEKHSSFTFRTSDGIEIYTRKWVGEGEEKPRAIIQFAHGMVEHIRRYDSFAEELVSRQIFAYGNDHRGHGMTAKLNYSSGYFADEEGFEKVVQDMVKLTTIIEKEYPGVPIFLFGHSLGSFLSRRYIQLYGDKLAGVILSGTGRDLGFIGKAGKLIAAREMKIKGRRSPSSLLYKLAFGHYNKAFQPNRTEFDWLNRDEKEIDKYIQDPFCQGVFTTGFFNDLLEGLEKINKSKNIGTIPVSLPIFFISGSKDPVGDNTKGVLKICKDFQKAGIEDVTYKFYENARHDLLYEINRDAVQTDIINWIIDHIE